MLSFLLFTEMVMAGTASRKPDYALSETQVRQQLTGLRDLFVTKAIAEGYRTCPAPQITLRNTPSFGNFIPENNEIVVASWDSLTNAEREEFAGNAAQRGGRTTAVSVFEAGTYRWVFVHELGHWWQSCRQQTRPNSFEEENGANRIALAFWRQQDPRFSEYMVHRFQALAHALPSPVPTGQTLQEYADANFASLSHGDAYTWLQANSITALATEDPAPSFHKSLSQPLYPL
jgi:hypothetical protein